MVTAGADCGDATRCVRGNMEAGEELVDVSWHQGQTHYELKSSALDTFDFDACMEREFSIGCSLGLVEQGKDQCYNELNPI